MSNPSELELQNAELRQQLEAAKTAQTSGWAGLFSLVGSVINLVPRWLVVAAGIVFIGWLGTEVYFNAQILIANKNKATADAFRATSETCNRYTVNPEANLLGPKRGTKQFVEEYTNAYNFIRSNFPDCIQNFNLKLPEEVAIRELGANIKPENTDSLSETEQQITIKRLEQVKKVLQKPSAE
jgi:hypothetical protein